LIGDRFKLGEWPFEKKLQTKLKTAVMKVLNAQGRHKDNEQRTFDRQDWWTYLHGLGFSDKDLLR